MFTTATLATTFTRDDVLVPAEPVFPSMSGLEAENLFVVFRDILFGTPMGAILGVALILAGIFTISFSLTEDSFAPAVVGLIGIVAGASLFFININVMDERAENAKAGEVTATVTDWAAETYGLVDGFGAVSRADSPAGAVFAAHDVTFSVDGRVSLVDVTLVFVDDKAHLLNTESGEELPAIAD
ncbi:MULTISPECIES: hypothetical protein [unclassified Pseudoclavibacter]|uniref:hypothetical protein n=1 Tax=unclassified Pseudoclavibacter TaxID=2615177 RepID=UPI00188B0BA6|nr:MULTISPECIES: hypothetical protein [unclassified Pseudoclavibacter]MBF4459526.1 hypothetical protein [Pseudoclavibacter sp. VKM Ac-2867]MBF4549442.1 hypothetical protein [Pseudoclavibacter sp. VKM Ac-2888]